MLEDCTTCGGRFIRARAADNAIVWVHPEPVDGGAIVLAGDPAREPTALWGLTPDEGDELYGVPAGAKRYRRHDCTVDGFDEDTDDGGLAALLAVQEAQLDRHRDHCVSSAVRAAIDTGTDDPTQFRQVAAQLLEVGHAVCLCSTAPTIVDSPHSVCVQVQRTLRAEELGVAPGDLEFTVIDVAPYGDPSVWDCEHGIVYRVTRKDQQ